MFFTEKEIHHSPRRSKQINKTELIVVNFSGVIFSPIDFSKFYESAVVLTNYN